MSSVDSVRRYLAEYEQAQRNNPRPSEFSEEQAAEDGARARLGSAAINALPALLAAFDAVHGPYPPGRPDWLVWSNEHRAWWAPGRCGYNTSDKGAGRYTLADALDCCGLRSPVPTEWGRIPAEVVVPSPELVAALLPVVGLRPAAFVLQEHRAGFEQEVQLECRRNEAGGLWWLVSRGNCSLNVDLEFEHQPSPSDHEVRLAFFERARFQSPGAALVLWRRFLELHPDPARPWLNADGSEGP